MKTYLFPEVIGHGEITEWVPADVARELLEGCIKAEELLEPFEESGFLGNEALNKVRSGIKKACGK